VSKFERYSTVDGGKSKFCLPTCNKIEKSSIKTVFFFGTSQLPARAVSPGSWSQPEKQFVNILKIIFLSHCSSGFATIEDLALRGGVEENPLKRCLKGVLRCAGWTRTVHGGGGFVLV